METQPIVQYQYRRSFLAATAMGASLCIVTFTLCAAVVVLYGMHIVDTKTQGLTTLVASAIKGIPEFADSLPPVFSDVLRDQRHPEYGEKLQIKARLVPGRHGGGAPRPAVEIQNTGTSVISLLALRATVLDRDSVPVGNWAPWGATPITPEDDWPGLLMPGATRYLSCPWTIIRSDIPLEELKIEVEITELRLWEPGRHVEAEKNA